jgi:hypothetical protein
MFFSVRHEQVYTATVHMCIRYTRLYENNIAPCVFDGTTYKHLYVYVYNAFRLPPLGLFTLILIREYCEFP